MKKKTKIANGVSAVVFFEQNREKRFLILHRVLNWQGWEFPKGSIEAGEKPEEAVLREIAEETGIKKILSAKKLPVFLEFFDSIRKKQRVMQCFLAKVNARENVLLKKNIYQEHDAFEWVDAETAMKKLSFEDQKKVFRTALKGA